MTYASVCSGIEAPSVAWEPLGWQPIFFSEIEPFPNAVLAHHYPTVPNLGDMTKWKDWGLEPGSVDVIIGGTPCQSFSVAGLRKGLDDPRGNLMLTYLAIVEHLRPRWVVWENVPGVLSSNKGRDFGTFLGALGQLGYGFAYRVLDAQYFGVAQKRRRVFVIGCAGRQWQRAAAVLFERESLSGNPAPSRAAREGVAGTLTRGFGDRGGGLECPYTVARTLRARANSSHRNDSDTFVPVAVHQNAIGELRSADVTYALNQNSNASGRNTTMGAVVAAPILARHGKGAFTDPVNDNAISVGSAVRRLTPRECERVQGFPDDYSLIPYREKPACDGPRYRALGNSMAVPVIKWIGERIQMVDEIIAEEIKR